MLANVTLLVKLPKVHQSLLAIDHRKPLVQMLQTDGEPSTTEICRVDMQFIGERRRDAM